MIKPLLFKGLPIALLALVLDLAVTTGTSATTATPHIGGRNLDAASSAQPSPSNQTVTDYAARVRTSDRKNIKGDAVATASATCDGCSGQASTVQILYLSGTGVARVDNVAAAWSQCSSCSSRAVSVQLVLLNSPATIVANNRSLALNQACTGCRSAAAAYQLVISNASWPLSSSLRTRLDQWAANQRAALDTGPGVSSADRLQANNQADDSLPGLQSLVTSQTGGKVVSKDAKVKLG
jgi:Fe-S cluster biogenesis protein NfuA